MDRQQSSSKRTESVRQPVSCEPCRRRKIKCSRTHPPCDTCRRRRCPDSCVYKSSREDTPAKTGNNSNAELLDRISNLETLLRKHTGAEVEPPTTRAGQQLASPTLSPSIELEPSYQLSPESFISDIPTRQTYSTDLNSSHRVGVLSTASNGSVRYEPRSSQWRAVLANTHLSTGTPSLEDNEVSNLSFGFPFTTAASPSGDDLLSILPPMQQCEYLKEKYFSVFSPLFHILHDPTFQSEYESFVEDPSSVPVSWLAILFILLSLAVTTLEGNDPVLRDLARGSDANNNIRVLSKRYREASLKCLAKQGVFWGKHNAHCLQALVLVVYAMGHCQEPSWVLLGMTYHVAIAMGYHIDPDEFSLTVIQAEERRRCWAGVIMLYTIQNTILGNPDPSWRITNDVKLPADVNDADITVMGVQEPTPGPTQMSYLLFKFRLYDLAAKICKETFKSYPPSTTTIQNLDQQIHFAQQEWDGRYLADTTFEGLPTHHAVHLHILHAYSHQLYLLLHRPFFAQSILGLDIPNQSQIRCIASAEALLDIHQMMFEIESFKPYMWYTDGLGSFHAFHAAAVLAVALLMPIYKPQYQRFKKLLDETLGRFEASSGRSKICEKASRILRFMLSTSSPNQASISSPFPTPESHHDVSKESLNSEHMNMFAERLQPQQWLGPASMAWTEWDSLMANA